jgi:hypothetical protein
MNFLWRIRISVIFKQSWATSVPSNTRRIPLTSRGDLYGVCPYMFINSSFELIYKTNLRCMYTTRGAGVVGKSTYPNIPNTTVNEMRLKRTSRTSPLTKAKCSRRFTACNDYPNVRHVGFNSLVFQMHHRCMRRELPCSIHTPEPNFAHWTRHPRLQTPFNKSHKIRSCGTLVICRLVWARGQYPSVGFRTACVVQSIFWNL